jgi:hypothetical protein
MERNYKITIPEPCTKNWDKMTPKESVRFCMSCAKTVVDFTEMLPNEVQHFFIQNQNQKICGRFKNEQLENLIIQIPSRVLYTQTHYHKMFLLALFIAMGTTLFSCSDKNGNKQKIDKVEVVEDVSLQKEITGKTLKVHSNDSLNEIPPPPPPPPPLKQESKNCSEKPTAKTTMGVIIPPNEALTYDVVYSSSDLDVLPHPKNGMKKFYAYFNKNYAVSNKKDKYEGKILFVVEKDGSLSNFNIIKNESTGNADEVIKTLETAPNWIPGKKKNRIVRSSYILKIPFNQ